MCSARNGKGTESSAGAGLIQQPGCSGTNLDSWQAWLRRKDYTLKLAYIVRLCLKREGVRGWYG